MLAFLKNIFARRSAPPARPAPSHGTPSPAAHRGGSRPASGAAPAAPTLLAPSRTPETIEEPREETPPPRFSTAPVPVPTVDPAAVVAVPWSAIFPRLHPALIKMAKHQPKSGEVLNLPLQAVLLQLASGAIRFRFEDFAAMTPNGCFAGADPGPVPLVELPLIEILRHVDKSYLSRRPEQHRIVVPDDIGSVFGKKDGNLKVITDKKAFAPTTAATLRVREVEESLAAHSSPPPLAPPKPPVQAAPANPASAPSSELRPPAPSLVPPKSAALSTPVPVAATSPLPTSLGLPRPSTPTPVLKAETTPKPPAVPAIKPPAAQAAPKVAPLPKPSPRPPSSKPSAPVAGGALIPPLRLVEEPPAAPISVTANAAQAAPTAPVAPARPITPSPAPSLPAASSPEPVQPTRLEPPALSPSLPAAASNEFLLPLADVAPHWAASGQHDLAALQPHSLAIPLVQLMASLKRGKLVFPWSQLRAWLRQAPGTTLPELDDALPVTLPLAVVAPLFLAKNPASFAPKKAALVSDIPDIFDTKPKSAPVAPAPEPAAPVADGVPLASKPLLEYGEIFGQPDKTTWSLREVAERCATLRGVAGMIIANHEGLLVADAWPTPGQSDAVAAFIPRMHQRMVEFSRELTLGESHRMTLTVENLPLEITRTGDFYMAVLGRAKENLPRVQLGAIAARLALHHQA